MIVAIEGCGDSGEVAGARLGTVDVTASPPGGSVGDALGGADEVSISGSDVGLSPDFLLGCKDGAVLGLSLLLKESSDGAAVGMLSPNCRNRCICALSNVSSWDSDIIGFTRFEFRVIH